MDIENVRTSISEFGWHSMFVFDPEGVDEDFQYSIGFHKEYLLPEIIIVGMRQEVAHDILWHIWNLCKEGKRFKEGERISDILVDYEVMFLPLKLSSYIDFVGAAEGFYGNSVFDVWVMLWPDKNNILPHEKGYTHRFQQDIVEHLKLTGT